MHKSLLLILLLHSFSVAPQTSLKSSTSNKTGTLKITFINVVKKAPMVLETVTYVNPFNETYSINKFKYYVSNIMLRSAKNSFAEPESYHLINQAEPASLSFSFALSAGNYQSLSFLLGVDSLRNVSGAQTDALDPANDMFWTWSSGYVMAKMEGNSAASPANNIFEFHIGGFSGPNKVLKKINFQLSPRPLVVTENKISEIVIESDADTWWQRPNNVKISATPNITSPGLPAKKISDNYSKMFTLRQIINK